MDSNLHCHCPEKCSLYSMVYHRCRGCRDLLPAIDGLKYNNPLKNPRQQEEEFLERQQDKGDVCLAQEVADIKLTDQPKPNLDDPPYMNGPPEHECDMSDSDCQTGECTPEPDRYPPFEVNEEYFEFKNGVLVPLGFVCFPKGNNVFLQAYQTRMGQLVDEIGLCFMPTPCRDAFYINARHSEFKLEACVPLGLICLPKNMIVEQSVASSHQAHQESIHETLGEQGYKFIPTPHKKA